MKDLRYPDLANGRWKSLYTGELFPWTGQTYSDANPPWALHAGETVNDNLPAGITVLNYAAFSAGSVGATLAAMRATATGPFVARLPAGTFHLTDFSYAAASGQGRGYQDTASTKYWCGLLGAGADQTIIQVDPSILTSTQLSGISSGSPSPVQVQAFYTSSGRQIFFSGITFRGSLQQQVTLSGLSGTAPAPYEGLHIVSCAAGSTVQYCRFQGFGFAAKASPPYELGSIGSSRSSWTLRRCEIDGRLATEIDSSQPVAAGGLMWNYETSVSAVDSWMHHTRRSGFAMHDQAPNEGGNSAETGVYYAENFQVEQVADTVDSYAGSPLGFATSNVEELRNTFTYVRPRFTASTYVPHHLVLATSAGNQMPTRITVTDPVCSGTGFDDLLVIRVVITPNSFGTNPMYTAYQASGLGALPITVTQQGKTLTPVLSTAYNANVHNSSNNYVVVFS